VKHIPFWVDDHPRPAGLVADLPRETDHLIVGSGLTGLAAALRLAGSGSRVTVLDAGEIASGASSINGGMVSPDVKAGIRTIYKRYGPELGREMWEATVRSVDIIDELDRTHDLGAVVARGGMTGLALHESDLGHFRENVEWYRVNLGTEWQVLDREQLAGVVAGSMFKSGFHEPEGIGVHPARLSFGLAGAARNGGVTLVANCAARLITRDRTGFTVDTARGPIRSGAVVIATNGYTTAEPVPELARKIVSVGSYIIVTEPLAESEAKEIFPTNSMSYTKRRLLNYMRRTHDHRILIGGRRNLRADLDLDASAAALRRRMLEFWPGLESAQITHVWSGKLGVPFDLTPHIGRVDGVWYAMGYAGHGVGLAALLGHDLAGMLLGETAPSVFSKIDHKGRFYHWGHPWFLGPASILYKTLDRLGR
jgi:glycine/D-amino acid oxidase-like deaminating enzyme